MGYSDNVTGYCEDLLANCAIAKHGNFVLLTPGGLIENVIPDSENYDATILSTPKLGVSLVDYLVALHQDGGNQQGFSDEDIETFLYAISGSITTKAEGKAFVLSESGYLYCPPGSLMTFVSAQVEGGQIFLYRHRYIPVEGHTLWLVSSNASGLERTYYKDMDDVILLDFLPKKLGFGVSMHTLSFTLGASHGYIKTYIQEHGAYILSDQGVYNLDNNQIPVEKGDYIFMGAYSLQAGYGVGRGEAFSYIYLKDCNRNVEVQVIPLV